MRHNKYPVLRQSQSAEEEEKEDASMHPTNHIVAGTDRYPCSGLRSPDGNTPPGFNDIMTHLERISRHYSDRSRHGKEPEKNDLLDTLIPTLELLQLTFRLDQVSLPSLL